MKIAIATTLISIILSGCMSNSATEAEHVNNADYTRVDVHKELHASDIEYLLQPGVNNYKIDSYLLVKGYSYKAKGIYTATDSDKNNKPSSWVSIVSVGNDLKMVSYKTSNKNNFHSIKSEISSMGYSQNTTDQTAFYVKYIGSMFEFEFHIPTSGVNTSQNEYYEILSFPIRDNSSAR